MIQHHSSNPSRLDDPPNRDRDAVAIRATGVPEHGPNIHLQAVLSA